MKKLQNKKAYCVEFQNSQYKVLNAPISSYINSYSTLFITFRTTARLQKTRPYIVSNPINDRSRSVQENQLQIWGTTNDPLILHHNINEWYTLFVQWTFMGDMKGYVYIMAENIMITSKTFTTKHPKSIERLRNVYIGTKSNGIDPWARGEITALELYTIGSPPEKVLPEPLRTVLMNDQNDVVTGEIPHENV